MAAAVSLAVLMDRLAAVGKGVLLGELHAAPLVASVASAAGLVAAALVAAAGSVAAGSVAAAGTSVGTAASVVPLVAATLAAFSAVLSTLQVVGSALPLREGPLLVMCGLRCPRP